MANPLSKIISIDGREFEVTAGTAEVAEKLSNKLVVNTVKKGVTTKVGEFDGSTPQTMDIEIPSVDEFITEIPDTYATKKYVDDQIAANSGGGSADIAAKANTIRVNMENDTHNYATVTISTEEPKDGNTGDIWFKY